MRLIDAEALLEKAWDVDCRCGYVQVVDVGSIEEAPTIEAKPIVHAHWEKGCDDEYIAIPWWTCSHCGKGALTKKETIYDQVLTDYCPYCGAQMDDEISE